MFEPSLPHTNRETMDAGIKIEKQEYAIERRCGMGNWLKGKTAIVIGERDGVQGPSIAACLEAAGAQVVYAVTECFV